MKINALLFTFLPMLLGACAFGPTVTHETGRTVGKRNHELTGGYGATSYAFKWNVGLTDNFDLGIQWEALSIGLRVKYAWVNNQEQGWSFSTAGGAGVSIGGSHRYVDLIGSHLWETGWEPYASFRFIHITTDPVEFNSSSTGSEYFTLAEKQYTYGQIFLGTRYWIKNGFYISGEISRLVLFPSSFIAANFTLYSVALGYRF